jgi:hypothetical protein
MPNIKNYDTMENLQARQGLALFGKEYFNRVGASDLDKLSGQVAG